MCLNCAEMSDCTAGEADALVTFSAPQDYVIDSNWRFRSTVMTPMFVETQSSQGPEVAAPSQSAATTGKLRATQTSLEFSQTQAAGDSRS